MFLNFEEKLLFEIPCVCSPQFCHKSNKLASESLYWKIVYEQVEQYSHLNNIWNLSESRRRNTNAFVLKARVIYEIYVVITKVTWESLPQRKNH